MKICKRCGEEKTLDHFGKNKRQKDGTHYWCKKCCSEHKKSHYQKYKNQISDKAKAYYQLNNEGIKDRARNKYWDNPDIRREASRSYQHENRERVYKRQAEWNKEQRKNNPQFSVRKNISRRLTRWVNGTGRFNAILAGCNEAEFILHIESLFTEKMNWDNYGVAWTFDHITPLTSFDLTDDKQIALACHFKNIQPLTAADNSSKGGANRMGKDEFI